MYPDQSLYPANAGPELAKRINRALKRADEIEHSEGGAKRDWFLPIVADAEAGFGGPLNCFEIMKAYIEAGASGVHYEDQLASEKKCGHLGGKVLIPTRAHERNLNAARLGADVMGVPTLIMARTDAESANLITSDIDERDHEFIDFDKGRTVEGFYRLKPGTGVDHCIKRGLAFAPYADLLWWETSVPNLADAKRFAEAVRKEYPDQLLAYNCSPSFNWEAKLDKETIAKFQQEIAAMGYKYQFVTLAGFHQLNHGMFELASGYRDRGMAAYSELQQAEFASEAKGYTATRHQREVGTGYFDLVSHRGGGRRKLHDGARRLDRSRAVQVGPLINGTPKTIRPRRAISAAFLYVGALSQPTLMNAMRPDPLATTHLQLTTWRDGAVSGTNILPTRAQSLSLHLRGSARYDPACRYLSDVMARYRDLPLRCKRECCPTANL